MPTAIVMGSSLGDLHAALYLRDSGWDIDVFERSRSRLSSRGAGIVLHGTTTRYLEERGLFDADRLSTHASRLRYLDRHGALVHEHAVAYRFTGWNVLYEALLKVLEPERYHLGHEVVAIDTIGSRARIVLADGRQERVVLLVCADGIASTARGLLLGDVQPSYAGCVAWRGTIPLDHLSASAQQALDEAILYHVGDRTHILLYLIPPLDEGVRTRSRLVNYVWYRNVPCGEPLDDLLRDRSGTLRELTVPPGAVREACEAALRRDARADLPAPFDEVVCAVAKPFIQVDVDVEVPRMVFGRVALMGDAAFTARPHAAAGTAKAAADARALAGAPTRFRPDALRVLAQWERTQLELGRRLVARSRDLGERAQVHGTYDPSDAGVQFGLYEAGDSSDPDAVR